MPVLLANIVMRLKSVLCPENTQRPTVLAVVNRAQAMIGCRVDGMSLFRFGGLRYFWFMQNVEFSVLIVAWWQNACPGPGGNTICAMPICCISLIGRGNYHGKKLHSDSGRAGRKCSTRSSMWSTGGWNTEI